MPFFALLCYLIFCLCKYCCCAIVVVLRKSNTQPDDASDPSLSQQTPIPSKPLTTSEVTLDDYVMDELYADRMINPSEYDELLHSS